MKFEDDELPSNKGETPKDNIIEFPPKVKGIDDDNK